ncbi:hypothetical protein OPV22_017141 [Ensete ventricosum]|uniref:Protein kinase domain-containing protein n=1 Tax=Ensete ventricosum TaxID=4639 RepID=A0AAV8PHG6_ENSVE|nr:hypothetical protein OPV22_017141 [Ensete ventricosum]
MPRQQQQRVLSFWSCRLVLLLAAVLLVSALLVGGGEAVVFNFRTLTLGNLKLLGDAHLKNGSFRLSRDLPVPNSGAGRALYAEPVRLRHPATRVPLPFSTFFSFSIINLNPSSIGGGLAFLLAPDDTSIGDAGGFLGLVNATASAAPGRASVVAVEFDTRMDVEFGDINGNHVGVDLGSLVSAQVADLDSAGIDLKSGDLINAWIEFGGAAAGGTLEVFVSYSTVRPADPVLSFPVDLGRYVDDFAFVGFSGSTQGSTEIHSVEWWSFSSPSLGGSPPSTTTTAPPPPATPVFPFSGPSPPSAPVPVAAESPIEGTVRPSSTSSCQNNGLCRQGPAAVAGVATASAFVVAAAAGLGFWVFTRRRTKSPKKWEPLAATSEIVSTPREFSYRELVVATRGFDSSRIIGHGAFGTVYKGIIPETGAMVAVKRILDAVDRRLDGEFDEVEMRRSLLVGLACSSPDPMTRPGMRNVVQMLSGEADPPFVPVAKPSMSFSTNQHLLLSLQDSVSDYNAMGLNLSMSSSSSSSLTSTLRACGGTGEAT